MISDENYKTVLENMPIFCVDVLVMQDGKALLVKRDKRPAKDEWWPLGGRLLKGEKIKDAAIRKVKEEAGLKIEIIKNLGVFETLFDDGPYDNMKSGVHSVNVGFVAECIDSDPNVKIDGTSSDYKWVDKIDKSYPEYTKKFLREAGLS